MRRLKQRVLCDLLAQIWGESEVRIVSRAELKDYVDIFFILKRISLPTLFTELSKKIPSLDQNLALKALVSFGDVSFEPIDFIKGNEVTFEEIQSSIIRNVKSMPLGIQ